VFSRGDNTGTLVSARWPDRLAEPLGALTVTLSTGDLATLEWAAKGACRWHALCRGPDGS